MPGDVTDRVPTGRVALARLAAVVASVLRCTDPPAPEPGDYSRMEGDGCGDSLSECIDAETLWECRERVWVRLDCSEACKDHGGAVECLAGEFTAPGALCWCADFAPICTPGTVRCLSDDEVEVCHADTRQFMSISCEAACAELAPPHVAVGCTGGCRCTTVGTPCAPGTPPHCEQDAIATCVDGLWEFELCTTSCPPSGNSCDPFAPGGAACGCSDH